MECTSPKILGCKHVIEVEVLQLAVLHICASMLQVAVESIEPKFVPTKVTTADNESTVLNGSSTEITGSSNENIAGAVLVVDETKIKWRMSAGSCLAGLLAEHGSQQELRSTSKTLDARIAQNQQNNAVDDVQLTVSQPPTVVANDSVWSRLAKFNPLIVMPFLAVDGMLLGDTDDSTGAEDKREVKVHYQT